jgi:hypothetical protein
MSGNPIGIVICRIGAVLLVISAFQGLGFVIMPLINSPQELDSFFAMSALMVLAPLVSAFFLTVYAEQISSTRFDASRYTLSEGIGPAELISIGTYLIGIYVLIFGVVHMFQTEAYSFAQSSVFEDNEHVVKSTSAHQIGNRVSYSVQIVLGFALLIRGKKGN